MTVQENSVTIPIEIGDTTCFSKTIGESDVYLFAGITGDFAPNHIDDTYMAGTSFQKRIAHGALLVGFMSTCSTKLLDVARQRGATAVSLSLGYDRIRFLAPVYLGDTIHLRYVVSTKDADRARTIAEIEVRNQNSELVAVATHLIKWVEPAA